MLLYTDHFIIFSGMYNMCMKIRNAHTQFVYCSNYKQLLDEVFVITLTETLIILDITKTKSNNCFIIHWTNAKTWKSCFCFFTDGKQHKSREVDMITLGNHALQSYMT